MNYNRAAQVYKSLRWVDGFEFEIRFRLNTIYGPKIEGELTALHKQVYPRRRKVNFDNLPTDKVAQVRKKWGQKAVAYAKHKRRQRELIWQWLVEKADQVDLTPQKEMVKLDTTSIGTYSSQGTGAEKYARGPLQRKAEILTQHDFETDIQPTFYGSMPDGLDDFEKRVWLAKNKSGFELWADASLGQMMAIEIIIAENPLDWAIKCWRAGVNPRVYNPLLPDEIFEKSLVQAF